MHLPKSLHHRFHGDDGRKTLLSTSSDPGKAHAPGPKRHSDPLGGLSRSLNITHMTNTTKSSEGNQDCRATRNLKDAQSPDVVQPPVIELVQRNGVTVVVKHGEDDLQSDPALLSKGIKAMRLSSVAHKLRSTSKTLSRVVMTSKFAHMVEDDNADTIEADGNLALAADTVKEC